MKRLIFFCFIFSCLVYTTNYGFSFFNNYEKNSTQENIQKLQDEQVNSPTDPWVNYNLGVALYKNRQYDSAKSCFERVGKNTQDPLLTKMGVFNLANSFYSNTLEMLPPDWEQQKDFPDDKILDQALNEVSQAITHYAKIINDNKKDIRAVKNNDKAEELRKKLEKKKKQNKQDKKDKQDKQDKDKQSQQDKQDKNDNKQNDKSKQDKQQEHQNQSQAKQDNQDQKDKQDKQQQKEQGQSQAINAMLDQLQRDESGSQKKIIAQTIKGNKGGDNALQKPW